MLFLTAIVCVVCSMCVSGRITDSFKKTCRTLQQRYVRQCFMTYDLQCRDNEWKTCDSSHQVPDDSLCFPFREYIQYMNYNHMTDPTNRITPCEESTTTNHQSTTTNHQSTITNHQSTITNHQSTNTNHQSTITNHQSTSTNHGQRGSVTTPSFIQTTNISPQSESTASRTSTAVPPPLHYSSSRQTTVTTTPTTPVRTPAETVQRSPIRTSVHVATLTSIPKHVTHAFTHGASTTARRRTETVIVTPAVTVSPVSPTISSQQNVSVSADSECQGHVSAGITIVLAISGVVVGIICTAIPCIVSSKLQRFATKLRQWNGKQLENTGRNSLHTYVGDEYSEINIDMTGAVDMRPMPSQGTGTSLLRLRPVTASSYASLRSDPSYDTIEDQLYSSLRHTGPAIKHEYKQNGKPNDRIDESGEHTYFVLNEGTACKRTTDACQDSTLTDDRGLTDSCRSNHTYVVLDNKYTSPEQSIKKKRNASIYYSNAEEPFPRKKHAQDDQYKAENGFHNSRGQLFTFKRQGGIILETVSDGDNEPRHEYFILQPLQMADTPLMRERTERRQPRPELCLEEMNGDNGQSNSRTGYPAVDRLEYIILDEAAMTTH